jgi:hypothetical protein
MKPIPKETQSIDSAPHPRFADRPALAALVAKMALALEERKRNTPWEIDIIRAEMLRRYVNVLDCPTETMLRNFLRWVVVREHYLAAADDFQIFCQAYLTAEKDEWTALWDMAGEEQQ